MGGEKETSGLVGEVLEIVSDPGTARDERNLLLRDSFFSHSLENMGALVRWVLSCESVEVEAYQAAIANLEEYLKAGNELSAEDVEGIRAVADDGSHPGNARAKLMLRMVEGERERGELERLGSFLFNPDEEGRLKKAIVEDEAYFLANPERVDLLVRFMLDRELCKSEIFEAAMGTYRALNAHGAAITDAQVSMVGVKLLEGECALRAHEFLELMLEASPRTVLENPNMPNDEKMRVLRRGGIFHTDQRAFGALLGFILDSELLLSSRGLGEAAERCFSEALGRGIVPKEDHVLKIVGTLTAGPGRRALQNVQRENALKMLQHMVNHDAPVPRGKCQGKVMNAAVEVLPARDSPGYEQQKERKIYGLRGMKIILGNWYEGLREGRDVGRRWHFRPEDLEKLRADAKHPDPEVRMEAMMVGEVLMKLLPLLEGEEGRDERVKSAIDGYLNPGKQRRDTDEILGRYLGKGGARASIARITRDGDETPQSIPDVEMEITPLALDGDLRARGEEAARRMIEKIKARRRVDKLPGEEMAEREAAKLKKG